MGGRLVLPIGDWYQELIVIERREHELVEQHVLPVQFVPIDYRHRAGRSKIRPTAAASLAA